MASYNPPTENITSFNSSLFNQPEETLSQAEADKLYLSKTKTDTSTAPLTIFNNQVDFKGPIVVGVQGGSATAVLYVNKKLRIQDTNGFQTGNGEMTYGSNGAELLIVSNNLAGTLLKTYIRFQTCPTGSTTPALRLEIADDATKITNNLNVLGSSTLIGDVTIGDASTSSGWLNLKFRTIAKCNALKIKS